MKDISQIPTNQLEPNPLQPRGQISPDSLRELVESIKEHGILEPLVVAKTPAGYQIIAGERRWRAARQLKLSHVPAIVKETTPQQMLEMAIVENVQRKDLNPMERAKAFLRRAEDISRRMRQKIEEGEIPITTENLPRFLRSQMDNIATDFQSYFDHHYARVKISQTNILTQVTFQ